MHNFKRSQQQQQPQKHIIRLSYHENLCLLHIIIHLLVPINFQVLFLLFCSSLQACTTQAHACVCISENQKITAHKSDKVQCAKTHGNLFFCFSAVGKNVKITTVSYFL